LRCAFTTSAVTLFPHPPLLSTLHSLPVAVSHLNLIGLSFLSLALRLFVLSFVGETFKRELVPDRPRHAFVILSLLLLPSAFIGLSFYALSICCPIPCYFSDRRWGLAGSCPPGAMLPSFRSVHQIEQPIWVSRRLLNMLRYHLPVRYSVHSPPLRRAGRVVTPFLPDIPLGQGRLPAELVCTSPRLSAQPTSVSRS